MDDAFDQLHTYIRRDLELTRAVRKALIYPVILLVVAIVVSLLIVIFVIPKFADFFADFDAELPLPTRMLMARRRLRQSPAGLITGLRAARSWWSSARCCTSARRPGRRNLHGFLLKMPTSWAPWSRTPPPSASPGCSASLLDAGVPLPDALPTAIDCTNNLVFKERLAEAIDGTLGRRGLRRAAAGHRAVPVHRDPDGAGGGAHR